MTFALIKEAVAANVEAAQAQGGEFSGQPAFNHGQAPELVAQFADHDRLCPMLAGVGWLDGNVLRLRLPGGDMKVRAPATLLRQVLELCDGGRSFNDILQLVGAAQAPELERFILHLLDQGALIDAIFATRLAARYAYQSTPVGLSAPDKMTLGICTRFVREAASNAVDVHAHEIKSAPLAKFFSERKSVYTFDDRPIAPKALETLLWSMGGVLDREHPRPPHRIPHRTLGSGGAMYLVRWMLVLQSRVGEYGPGVYDVIFPRPNQVALTLRTDETRLLLRAYLKPWQLSHAAGAIFGVADVDVGALRYRNRALQYLFTEAGAALQNMALSSAPLGIATSIIGGYCEDTASRLLQLDSEIVVGSAIFGSPPTVEQEKALSRMMPIDFVWSDSVNDIYALPFHIARAQPEDKDGDEFHTWGKDRDPRLAYVKAHAEAVERQGFREPRNIVVARMDEVPDAISPDAIATYSEAQLSQPGFMFKRFNAQIAHPWVAGVRIDDAVPVSVPAQFVYGRNALRAWQPRMKLHLQWNSSGCAAGRSLDSALTAGLLEVVERDAFMRHWLAQSPGLLIPDVQLPASVLSRVRQMRLNGCAVTLQLLHSHAAQVVLVSATHDQRHFTCVSAAARFDRAQACAAALDELETMVFTRLVGMDVTPLAPEDVADPRGHTLLYSQRRYYRRAARVLAPRYTARKLHAGLDTSESLQDLTDLLIVQGFRPSYVDITPQRNCIEQGRTPLTVIKAIVPGLIPMSFGYGREPRGMVTHVHPGSFFPHPFP